MLTGEVLVQTRHGVVAPARLGIHRVAEDLHRAARRLRIFAATPTKVDPRAIQTLIEAGPEEIQTRLGEDRPLATR